MAYTTRAEIEKKISEDTLIDLTDDNDTGSVNDNVMDQAIADADTEIDGYIAVVYSSVMPFSSTPRILQKYSTDISVKNLYEHRKKVTDWAEKAYDSAIAFLKLAGQSKTSIGLDIPRDSQVKTDDVEIRSNPRKLSYNVPKNTGRMTGFI